MTIDFPRINKAHIFLCLLAVSLLPYFYLALFCHPIADDLIYAYKSNNFGFIESFFQEYNNWSGRYIAIVFGYNNPINYSLLAYQLIPIGIILLIGLGTFILLNSILCNTNRMHVGIISLLITLTYIGQLPNIAEGVYWYSGAVAYLAPIFPTMLFFSLLYNYMNKKWFLNKPIHLIVIIFLQFTIIGFNEVHMIYMLLFHLVLAITESKKKKSGTGFVLLITAIIFSSILIFSPGNALRSSLFTHNHDVISSGINSLLQTLRFSLNWISSAPILLLSILYIPLHFKLAKTLPLFQNSFYLKPQISLILLLSTIFIASFAPYWSTGILGQHRTLNTAWFFFLFIWFINLSAWCNHFQSYLNQFKLSEKLQNVLLGLIWLTLTFTNNGYGAAEDIFKGKAKRFDQLMSERYITLEKAKSSPEQNIYLRTIDDRPNTLFVLDISNNPNHWINTAYSMFFEITDKAVKPKDSN